MSDHSSDWVGQTLSGGRYRVDAKLGEGGMGFVYKVWDRNLDTDVVVKAPRKSMLDDPEFASRFALEIRSLVKLSHPNIVKVSDVGEHEGLPFAVMQYLTGGTLDERLDYGRDGRPLPAPPASLSAWLPGMAAALDFIHGKGYIHRDVKPANILFDAHGHPYLSDFGVAKVLSDVEAVAKKGPAMTGIGIVLGTPDYMAPELIMGNSFDGQVDQYALAATAYEILCGRKPFSGDTPTAILVRQTTQEPPPMNELGPSGAPAISKAILRGLAKKPGDRFATCVEFANALVAALAKAGGARPPVDRLACPSCGVGFAATGDLASFGGRKSKCRACGKPFRIAQDGLSLERIDPDALPTPSGSVEVPAAARNPSPAPSANRTVKMEAMPAPGRAEQTMKMDAMPGPTRVERTMKMEAMPGLGQYDVESSPRANRTAKMAAMPVDSAQPFDDEPEGRSFLPWVICGVGVAAVAVLAIIIVATRPSPPGPTLADSGGARPPAPIKSAPSKRPTPPAIPPPIAPPTPNPRMALASTPTPSPEPSAVDPGPAPAVAPAMETAPPIEPQARPELEVPPEVEKRDEAPPRPRLKAGQAREHLTLRQIVADPADHLDEVVSPSDLCLVGTHVVNAAGLAVRSTEGSYQTFVKPETPFEIVLRPELAAFLRQEFGRTNVMQGDYPAMLRMRVEKGIGGVGYRGVVEWLEFLYYVDARFLEGGAHLNKALFVLNLTPDGSVLRHSLAHKDWEVRLRPSHIIPNVRNTYIKEGRPPAYKDLAVKATRPDRVAAIFFHNWIKARVH